MLGGLEIKRLVESGEIGIEPFNESQLNPNSYNCRLYPKLLTYKLKRHTYFCPVSQEVRTIYGLDSAEEPEVESWDIPLEGFWLIPGVLYLGCTDEVIHSGNLDISLMPKSSLLRSGADVKVFAPHIETRSGYARLGLSSHLSAGWGDCNFSGQFTTEITVVHPLKIYPYAQICQVAFTRPNGEFQPYQGKYQGQRGPVPSRVWKEFQR